MSLFKKIKDMFAKPVLEDLPDSRFSVDAWYDSDTRLWVAQYKDGIGNQVGATGYGPNKKSAVLDLQYQNHDII